MQYIYRIPHSRERKKIYTPAELELFPSLSEDRPIGTKRLRTIGENGVKVYVSKIAIK